VCKLSVMTKNVDAFRCLRSSSSTPGLTATSVYSALFTGQRRIDILKMMLPREGTFVPQSNQVGSNQRSPPG